MTEVLTLHAPRSMAFPMATLKSSLDALTTKFVTDLLVVVRSASIADLQGLTVKPARQPSAKPSRPRTGRGTDDLGAALAEAKSRTRAAELLGVSRRTLYNWMEKPPRVKPNRGKEELRAALGEAKGSRTKAAKLLGVSRRTFYNWMEQAGIT